MIIRKIIKLSFLLFFTQASENAELVGVRDGCFERPAFGRSLETHGRSLLGKSNENRPKNCFERVFFAAKRFLDPQRRFGVDFGRLGEPVCPPRRHFGPPGASLGPDVRNEVVYFYV